MTQDIGKQDIDATPLINDAGAVSRRVVLKGTGAVAGAALGSQAITGLPAVWSQEPKILSYLGTAVNQSAEIAKKVKEDTGITIQYISVDTDEVTKRAITQPNSFDMLDTEYFSLKKLVPSGNLLDMDARKIANFDKITPMLPKANCRTAIRSATRAPRPGRSCSSKARIRQNPRQARRNGCR